MIRASILGGALAAGVVAVAAAWTAPMQGAAAAMGAGNYDKLSKMVRSYYGLLEEEKLNKAQKELEKLLADANKIAKDGKFGDPLLALDDWREILKRGLMVEKTVLPAGRADLKLESVASPFDRSEDAKELGAAFDNKLKAYVSLPNDFAKVAYPIVLGLHPIDPEVKAAKDLAKTKTIQDKVKAWATATYSKEFLTKAIVVCPVMDLPLRGADNVSYSRPAWESREGAQWAFNSLREFIFKNLNYDASRIYVDGSGSAAAAALLYCARFPGVTTGAIVRGAPPEKVDFANCRGTPLLFVGAEPKAFFEANKALEGFVLEHRDALDDAGFATWLTDHPKVWAPRKIAIETDQRDFASSYWLRITDEDPAKEKLGFKVDAAIDAEKNQITVVTNEKVKGFEIYLNDAVVDLSRPIKVIHRYAGAEDAAKETVRFEGAVKRVIEDTLKWAYDRPFNNTGEIYVAMVRVDLG
jgi:hypothetical protein